MRPQELNLLVIFDAVMTENSITRTTEQLSMTQPAVSNAVARMRTLWKDDLFVKDGRNIQPTTYAKNLWSQIRDPLHSLSQAVSPDAFDPMTARRTFRIATPDVAVDSIWLELRLLFEQKGPGLNLHAVPYTVANTRQILENADVDLVIGASNRSLENIQSDHLFDTRYVCAMRKDHPLAKPDLSVAEFAAADHLVISWSGDAASATDQALHQLGFTRRVAFTVNHFAPAVPIIKETDLIAILPTDYIDKHVARGELSITRTPVEVPHTSISMLWHKRQNRDAGLQWLRRHIKKIYVPRRTGNMEHLYQV
jgi:DNA-binding transcriptional LysR family regulator